MLHSIVYHKVIIKISTVVLKNIGMNISPMDFSYADWYNQAHNYAQIMAEAYNVTVAQAAAVIAVTSANKSWEQNLKCANEFFATGYCPHYDYIKQRCKDILTTTDITELGNLVFGGTKDRSKGNGNKVFNFFLNILFPDVENGVTIDRHAAEALGFKQPSTTKQYKVIEMAYVELTAEINRLYGTHYMWHQVQAMIWVKHRELKNGTRYGKHV